MSFLLSMLMTAKDVSLELADKTKELLVSDEKELKEKLSDLKVDLSKVKDADTGEEVKDWKSIMGVFKKNNEIFAYSSSLNSELSANIRAF